ncbi:metal-sensitive transcriptional regulator [Aerococcus urinaeequi]|uniref:Cytoplasmic protein n=1 Tax=Aerococcus urinaeequi TaxID=51665 RepID=A0A0U4WQ27_9LACT|nr:MULTISPECIES: metal-sensitive transcriptional regulator [Lactobacillales]KAF3300722.1 metal-sensing transcriptional repressor [Carnobacterium sp. PL17RED31]ALZ87586.1 cytoplasmic protein [Aerococcus urinaeequi]AMB96930.1 cytoplasmic protein [Aerococcus urinaeequi]KAF3302797.1 metal-sensing transcriptional repressor [Carnobacterium sp. PL12RED10]KAF3303838.1 metal-sensing transcriptional repressor [Carnobacterium sp. PL26RED25]
MEYDKKIVNRLKRSDGQLHGVLNMMEEGKDCVDIVTQLSAVRSSIDRTISLIVAENLVECVQENIKDGSTGEERIQQAIQLLMKSR